VRLIAISIFNSFVSEGAANLNDMKEMLANLPQFQEQREKVRRPLGYGRQTVDFGVLV
jgi:hypothetical protein